MSDEGRPDPRPGEFKTTMDGQGGLVRIPLAGGLHDGRELFIDEPDVPEEIYAVGRRPFEWWPARLHEQMRTTPLASDPAAPPIRYLLRVDEQTREPSYVAQADDR